MNLDRFLKDIVECNIKLAVAYDNSEDIYSKDHDYHEFYHQNDFRYSDAFIIITLKSDEVYFVVPSTCCCPYVEIQVKEIEFPFQCDCK